jgi:hypothetical protein
LCVVIQIDGAPVSVDTNVRIEAAGQIAVGQRPLSADCVEKLADDYFKAIFAQRNFASSFFLESSLRCPRVADSNITDKNGCRSFSTQSGNSTHSSIAGAASAKRLKPDLRHSFEKRPLRSLPVIRRKAQRSAARGTQLPRNPAG